jgi:DNA-binding transcriptional MerR regulator
MTTPTGIIGIGEASRMLGLHPTTLRRWADTGQIDFIQHTPRSPRRFFIADILAMLETQRREDPLGDHAA